ncbi:MAG: hypothetical protein U0527_04170 [Candidatus Eisenbacteria bacterium]
MQSPAAQRFLNVRTRLTYGQTLPATGAGLLTTWGEVEDDRILNFVEMFDQGPGNMVSLPSGCDPWRWCDGPQFWLPGCPPLFLPDQGQNGYMAVYWDSQPQYLGDSFDSFRTPDFDLSELTEAHLSFQYSAVEVVEKIRVVLYKNGAPFANLALLDGIAPNAYPCGGPPHDALIDLSPFCEDGFTNVAVAFEVDWDEPCVTPPMIPQHYVDFVLDNVCLWGEDKIAPGATTVTATATSENTTVLNWIAPGDDDLRHRAELYNLRYSPWPIDASNWRRAMWVRRDMANIPTPGVPGTVEGMTVSRLESGLHHFAVLTQDEVNNLSVPSEGGLNHPPTITSPGAQQVTARSNLTLTLSASDPDFDRLFLICTQKPSGADFQDQGNGTATFSWTPGPSDVGSTTVSVTARDWNGASSSTDFTINVLPAPSGGRGACCMKSTGCCLLLTAAQCSAQGASFHGVGTPCDPNPCLAPGVDFADHAVGAIKLTMTDQGTIGFMDASQSQGSGLRYPSTSTNHLYIGGLWVGNQSFVANRDFDADPNKDWVVSTCPDGQITSASQGTKQTLTSRYIDAGALAPLGLAVTQESWALSSPGSDDDFVIVRCTLSNDSGAPLGGLYAGLFLDLDIRGNGADDLGGTDGGRKLVYIGDASNTYVGLRTLDWNGGAPLANLTLIPNLTYVYPNAYILDADKGRSSPPPMHRTSCRAARRRATTARWSRSVPSTYRPRRARPGLRGDRRFEPRSAAAKCRSSAAGVDRRGANRRFRRRRPHEQPQDADPRQPAEPIHARHRASLPRRARPGGARGDRCLGKTGAELRDARPVGRHSHARLGRPRSRGARSRERRLLRPIDHGRPAGQSSDRPRPVTRSPRSRQRGRRDSFESRRPRFRPHRSLIAP